MEETRNSRSGPLANGLREPATDREISLLLEREVVAAGVAPAASAAVARRHQQSWCIASGAAGTRSRNDAARITTTTLFDLASVTKPIFTVALLRYLGQQGLTLNIRLDDVLPELGRLLAPGTTLELLLSHRAGLEAHLDLFLPLTRGAADFDRPQALELAARARRPDCLGSLPDAGFPPLYSDLGVILAAEAARILAGCPIDELIDSQVCQPLSAGLWSARQWREQGVTVDSFAPTETVAWRGGELSGVVHDENCWALAGFGCSGHAGLFGTALSVVSFGCAFLNAVAGSLDWLGAGSATALLVERPGGSLRVGFDGKSATGSAAGPKFGSRTFGHLGFTGTSLWCDHDANIVVALTTNRVCPSRGNHLIREARPRLHGLLFDLANGMGA